MQTEPIYFNLNPVNFFIVSGLLQNFILAGILYFRKGDHSLANRFLSLTIITVNLHLTYLMVLDTNLDNLYLFILWVPYSYLTAIGPLIFFYTRALTDINFRLSNISVRHFLPTFVEVLIQLILIALSIQNGSLFYNTPLYFYVAPILYAWTAVSILYYVRQSLDIISNHESWVLRNYSNLKEITLQWLRKLIIYYRVLWIIWVPFVATFLLFFRFQLMYFGIVLSLYLMMLALTYLTSWIGLEGLLKGSFVLIKDATKTENKNFKGLAVTDIETEKVRIERTMTVDRMFLKEDLTLRDVANSLAVDPNLISHILNSHLGSSFYDFVNRYRIGEVKKKMQDPGFAHLTLLGIALESGFNSKTTFNRVFKQVTGQTPREFQQSLKKTSE